MPEVCKYLDTFKRGAEALYVVNQEFDVSGFQCHHVELRDEYHGSLLVSPRWYDGEPVSVKGDQQWFNGVSTTLSTLISDGIVTVDDATDRLIETTLTRMRDNRHQRVLAHSTAVPKSVLR